MMKLIQSIFLGIFAAIGALILEMIASSFFPESSELKLSQWSLLFLFSISLIEETLKFLAIRQSLKEENSFANFIGNSLSVGLGFSLSELGIKLVTFSGDVSKENEAAFFFHLLSTFIMGTVLFRKKSPSLFFSLLLVLSLSLFHWLFNIFLISIE